MSVRAQRRQSHYFSTTPRRVIVYSSIPKTHKIYSPRRPGTWDLCTRGGGGGDRECPLNGVVGMYGFLTPRDFCTFSDNCYGCSLDGLGCRTLCVYLWGCSILNTRSCFWNARFRECTCRSQGRYSNDDLRADAATGRRAN